MNQSKKLQRERKISDLIALVKGELTPDMLRGRKQLISIDWGDDGDGSEDWSVFLIDGKKVNRETFNKELLWREENKK